MKRRLGSKKPGSLVQSTAASDSKRPSERSDSGVSGRFHRWPVAVALAIGCVVILSDGLVVHRNELVPARNQSSSIRTAAQGAGETTTTGAGEFTYFVDFDGYYWVSYARQMVSDRAFRVRRTDLDNAPFGREVHWSSVFSWWLIVLGSVHGVVSGSPLGTAIESAAIYANPVLMGLLLGAVAWLGYRRLGSLGGCLMVLMLALQPALLRDFGYARPDHHGLHLICALGVVLLAVLAGGGWVAGQGTTRRANRTGGPVAGGASYTGFALGIAEARRWFIASGVLGGCGLWIGATQQALVIGCVGLGALVATVVATRPPASATAGGALGASNGELVWAPELWRVWGRAGALTSLIAYGIEYLPGHIGMRLEVNHPLYALAWLSAAELLFWAGKLRMPGREATRTPVVGVGLAAVGVVLVPALVLFGPASWYVPKQPLMLRVHSLIGEFRPLVSEFGIGPTLMASLLPLLLVAAGIGVLWWRGAGSLVGSMLLIGLFPSFVLAALFFAQVRWQGLFICAICGLVAPLLLVVIADRAATRRFQVGTMLVLLAIGIQLVPNAGRVLSRVWTHPPVAPVLPLADEVFARDLGLILDAAAGRDGRQFSVMAGLAEGSRVHAFSGARAVGSQYWENFQGIADMVDFFADSSDDEALRMVRERGIEYVVVTRELVSMVHMLKYGNANSANVERTLAYRLFTQRGDLPTWCRPIVVRGFRWADSCRIYRVTDLGQSRPDEASSAAGDGSTKSPG